MTIKSRLALSALMRLFASWTLVITLWRLMSTKHRWGKFPHSTQRSSKKSLRMVVWKWAERSCKNASSMEVRGFKKILSFRNWFLECVTRSSPRSWRRRRLSKASQECEQVSTIAFSRAAKQVRFALKTKRIATAALTMKKTNPHHSITPQTEKRSER